MMWRIFTSLNTVKHSDVVITQDIPLADLIVKLGAVALDPRGDVHTEETIQERLSVTRLYD
jgi:uncharacterized protein YaiI (UPF0178 family)